MAQNSTIISKKEDVMDEDTASAMLLYIAGHHNNWTPSISQEFISSFGDNIKKQIRGKVAPFCKCLALETFAKHDNVLLAIESIVKSGGCEHNGTHSGYRLISFTPIHIAAGVGNVQLLSCLIDNHADMYSVTKLKSLLPFELALFRKNHDCAQLLIEKGFQYPKENGSLFFECIRQDDTKAAQYCMDAGVPIDVQLWMSCMRHSLEKDALTTVEWLLDTGIGSANQPMSFNCMPFGSVWISEQTTTSPLHHARSIEMVELLVKKGANPTNQRFSSTSILTNHIVSNRLDVCEAILTHFPTTASNLYSDPTAQASLVLNSYLPLHFASWRGNLDAVDLLLKYNADCHAITGDRNTALGLACHGDSLDCVQRLVSLGCDPNVSDKDEDTALIYATFNGNSNISKLLLENGANPHIKNSANVTPLWNAINSRSLDIVQQLLRLNVDFSVKTAGVDIHSDDSIYDEEVNAIFVAVHHEQIGILKALLDSGCFLHRELSAATDPVIPMYVDTWAPDNKRWLEHVIRNPPTLSWWCKKTVRSSIKYDFQNSIRKLPISSQMKCYVIGYS